MIIHCTINDKPKPKDGMKPVKVEFENRGYWAKWYLAYDTKQAKDFLKRNTLKAGTSDAKLAKNAP